MLLAPSAMLQAACMLTTFQSPHAALAPPLRSCCCREHGAVQQQSNGVHLHEQAVKMSVTLSYPSTSSTCLKVSYAQ